MKRDYSLSMAILSIVEYLGRDCSSTIDFFLLRVLLLPIVSLAIMVVVLLLVYIGWLIFDKGQDWITKFKDWLSDNWEEAKKRAHK